ncbi:hypothetical protein [Paenibacillus oryzae]|uniref:glycoside hydrolase family 78 protein n=1 Tax=Paenibacillus oryzae TaxID=1844972 RepID=UPI0012E9A08E|nr:hypothetical protein [Paenibacillus oryzae]
MVLTKKGNYHIDGDVENPSVNEKVVVLDSIKPVGIDKDRFKEITNEIHGGIGYADKSTEYINKYDILSKTSIRAYFKQDFGGDSLANGYYKDWANPGARQMWWYAALQFRLEAITYRYIDKHLVVEWVKEDVEQERSTINVRHIVRTGPTGSYTTAAQSVIPFNKALPFSEPVEAGDYGKLLGSNTNYIGFGSTLIQNTALTINVTLSKTNNQTNAYVTFMYEKEAPPFTGDFDIVPPTINFREPFSFVPKNFQMNACVYQSHKYKIERGGTFVSETQTGGQNQKTSYSYSKYPWNIGIGTHTVSINIKTSCGETGWINPKPLTVNDMTDNSPPRFKIGFVHPAAQTIPIYQVVEGTVLNLIYIEDSSVPTPDDPDGDDIYFMGFDTEGSISRFIRELPSKYEHSLYGNGYHRITMDTLGYHHVSAQMRDQWGATSTASTWIQVIPKNPIAMAKGPATVKSGRPVPDNLFDSSQSYSPVGRKINHARDEWENKKDKYINETEDNIFEYVKLHVYDSEGLKSIDPGVHTLIVEPDLPPVAKLEVPSLAVRNQTADIVNRSYSPDGDKIVKTEYKYKYDAKNNGFEDDEWVTLLIGTDKALPFKPTKVGKYLFYVKVTEDYGKWGDTDWQEEELLIMDVVNDSPTISFDMEGKNEQPDLEPLDPYYAKDIVSQWKLYEVNSNTLMKWPALKWNVNGKTLLAGSTGKMNETQTNLTGFHGQVNQNWAYPFQNMGLGYNNLSPYRAIERLDYAKTQPLLINNYLNSERPGSWEPTDFYKSNTGWAENIMEIRSNDSHFYFNDRGRDRGGNYYYASQNPRLYAFNKSKVGSYASITQMPNNNPFAMYLEFSYPNGSPYDFILGPESIRAIPKLTYDQYYYPDYWSFQKKDKTNAQFMRTNTLEYAQVRGHKVAEKTIYQSATWTCYRLCGYYYASDGYSYEEGVADIIAYDAFTGEYISSAFATGALEGKQVEILTTKGDNLLLFDRAASKIYELNRQGKIVETYPWFIRPSYTQNDRYGQPMTFNSGMAKDAGYSDGMLEGVDAWYVVEATSSPQDEFYQYGYLSLLKIWKKDLTVAWRAKLKGRSWDAQQSFTYKMGNIRNHHFSILINEMKDEIFVRSYSYNPHMTDLTIQHELVNTKTGAVRDYSTDGYVPFTSAMTNIGINWYGNIGGGGAEYPYITTAEGWKTRYTGDKNTKITDGAYQYRTEFSSDLNVNLNSRLYQGTHAFYVGDGMYITISSAYNYSNGNFVPVLHVGTPTTDPLIYNAFTLGQWVSKTKLKNAELAFNMALYQPKVNSKLAGMSFRMQNPTNRYAVEADGQKLYLSKYTGGNRTVLGTQNFIAQPGKAYSFRILMQGEAIKVYMDGVPYFEVTDSQYDDGYFGMFSDRGLVDFDKIGSKELPDDNVWSTQYAIWEEADAAASIRTDNVIFEDPEKDPIAELDWSIFHTVRFINNQGQSSLHGKSITEGELKLDNVGDYKVALRGRDDPNPKYLMPDMAFDDYRKNSNEFVRMITVHRRPVADFELQQRESDGQVFWTDNSVDPDRYESATHYSDEVTGIDYKATKGILEKRFYYITPSGDYVPEKLITPQEKGTYEVALAVKDEYGAWSNWTVRMLDIDKLPPPNTPPTPGFTKTHTTTYRGVTVTIDSTASDLEDGDRTKLPHTYYVRNKTANGAEAIRSSSRTDWTISFDKLGTYNIRQLVSDSHGATAQAEQEISIVNRKPVANVTYPTSTDQNNPTKVTVPRPAFTWTYSDADNDAQTRYQVQIYRYGGVLLLDSGSKDGADKTWTASADLPEKTNMYVQVRVHDGFDWSDWSTVRYFYIETNQPPTADFTWSPQPVYEGDTVQFRSIVSDPDRDTLSVSYELTDPAGKKSAYNYSFQPNGTAYPDNAPNVAMAQIGDWLMKMTVSDGKAEAVTRSKIVKVLPLSLTGTVHHTELWNEHRQNYNKKKSGNAETPRGYEVFWAGEKFILKAATTATGTNTKAEKVEVTFGKYKTELKSLQSGGSSWQGELWDSSFKGLKNGEYRFDFTVFYSNGIVKTDSAEIRIQGNASGIAGVHRVQ